MPRYHYCNSHLHYWTNLQINGNGYLAETGWCLRKEIRFTRSR
jgi:hypothetical protein